MLSVPSIRWTLGSWNLLTTSDPELASLGSRQRCVSEICARRPRRWKPQREYGPSTVTIDVGDVAAKQAGHSPADREPKAVSVRAVRARVPYAKELFEHLGLKISRNSRPAIPNFNASDFLALTWSLLVHNAHANIAASRRVFDRVRH